MRLPAPCSASDALRVVLVNPYELGRQPFALAQLAAWIEDAGMQVDAIDLSLSRLDPVVLGAADAVVLYLGMHTATRIAVAALPRIRALAPRAALAAFGLYAPVNAELLQGLGVHAIFGGECEPDIVAWLSGAGFGQLHPTRRIGLDRIAFKKPERRGLPELARYAQLVLPDGSRRVCGFVETTRGCKHLCRHCPVVPVYRGRFVAVPLEVVLEDIAQQVEMGAQHISFTDHDFFNGPTHAVRVLEAMHARWPELREPLNK